MKRLPPPVYLAAALAAQHAVARRRRTSPARVAAGVLLAGGAVGLQAWAMLTFREHGTTVDPVHPEKASEVVAEGPFALTRNPMYVAMTGLLAAHALARGGPLAPLPAAAFAVLIDRTQIPAEEAALERGFGPAYAAYRDRVPRWLGLPR